ncbi:MAG TPA: hypothetical protein ENH10_01270, partial [Bacteroidetes bacterium]|nr:hypothetical protein [Bacteroidota bacterium]HEX03775.1 hypothetical protein [Bacteroidota bacterium]
MKLARLAKLSLILLLLLPTLVMADSSSGEWLYVRMASPGNELDALDTTELLAISAVQKVEAAVPASAIAMNPDFATWQRVHILPGEDLDLAITNLQALPSVDIVERPPVRELCVLPGSGREITDLPNDPLAPFQWHLATVNAFAAWDEVGDAEGAIIAILDNGVDIDHPDLASIIWRNSAEANGQGGLDDDGNGFIDDIYGWDAYDQDGNPDAPGGVDSPGHGTHCSGIAAAISNNGIGVSGLGRGAKIMAVRIGEGRAISETVEGLVYAVVNGADIISMSFAGPLESVFERDVINFAVSQGTIVLAAAGNGVNGNGVQTLTYPAAYENVIGVAATDLENSIAGFSNYGWWVQAAAPGVDILSTSISSSGAPAYGYSTGTSMSTPLVAGLAALLKNVNPDITQAEFLARIQQGSQPVTNGNSMETPVGVIDAWRSVLPDRPVVAVNDWFVDDGDDHRLLAGETEDITFNMDLLGMDAESVHISLVPLSSYLTVSTLYDESNQSIGSFTPSFRVRALSNADQGDHPAVLLINADGWKDTLSVRIPVDPPWLTVESGDMIGTVSDYGALGFRDYLGNNTRAEGFRLNDDMLGLLFHGSLMIGDNDGVADNAYGSDGQNQHDFQVINDHHFTKIASVPGQEKWQCQFTDRFTPGLPVGVEVQQTVTSYEDGGNILYLDYAIRLVSGGPTNLYVGLFCDWDILNFWQNQVQYNSDLRLSYMSGQGYGSTARFAGIVARSDHTISGVRAIQSSQDLSDSDKLSIMQGGTNLAASSIQSDWANLIAVELEGVSSTT